MKVSEIVGYRMRLARAELGWTQTELGKRLGEKLNSDGRPWHVQSVSAAEKGRRAFTAEELLVLSSTLRHEVGWFFLPPDGENVELPGTKWWNVGLAPREKQLVERVLEAARTEVRRFVEEDER